MKYTVEKLQTDVMARLGEIAQPPDSLAPDSLAGVAKFDGVPTPQDIISEKVRSLLPEIGARLIREASDESLGSGAVRIGADVAMQMMPCGLYGAELSLPEGFLRLVSVKWGGWKRSVHTLFVPGSVEWSRQWSSEPGIAGCPDVPRAYLDSDGEGMVVRLVGIESDEDELESFRGWCVPVADDEGKFDFPVGLYGDLVGMIVERLG